MKNKGENIDLVAENVILKQQLQQSKHECQAVKKAADKQVKNLVTTLHETKEKISQQALEIAASAKEISAHEQRIKESAREIIERDEKIAEKEQAIVDKDEKIAEKDQAITAGAKEIIEKDQTITSSIVEIENLKHELAYYKRLKFDKTSEKFRRAVDPSQLSLAFAEIAALPNDAEEMQDINYQRRRAKKSAEKNPPHRQKLDPSLERRITVIEPDFDTTGMEIIGHDDTERLSVDPLTFFVEVQRRNKYIKRNESGKCNILQAALQEGPIQRGIPTAELLTHILLSKYVDHMPVDRQIKQFKRHNIRIPSSTIYGWLTAVGKMLEPLYLIQQNLILQQEYIMVDETTIKVLDNSKKNRKIHRGYFWVYKSPESGQVFFEYNPSRGEDRPMELLNDFKGYVQSDGYVVYEKLENQKGVTLVACMAHARRKVFEALKNNKKVGNHILGEMQKLYWLEAAMKKKKKTYAQRGVLRARFSKPILERLESYMREKIVTIAPGSMKKAIVYYLKRSRKLSEYTNNGLLEIDNNLVENAIRPVALGRKNFLFAGSPDNAQYAAIFYSLFESCRHLGVNPRTYFINLLKNINDISIQKLHYLLPGAEDLSNR